MLNRFSNRLFCKGLFFFLLLFAVVTCQVSAQQKQGNQNLPDLKVGKKAPAFSITDIAGNKVNLADYKGKIVVLEWNNPFCPFVVPHYESGNIPNMQKKIHPKECSLVGYQFNNRQTCRLPQCRRYGQKSKGLFARLYPLYS